MPPKLSEEQRKYLEAGGTLRNGQIPIETAPTETAPGIFAPITSPALAPITPIQIKTPIVPPIFPVSELQTFQEKLTEPEKQISETTQRTQALLQQLGGETEFRAQQEKEQKLPELIKTQQDLSSQLFTLQKEAQAIPLQVQNEFLGRASVREQQNVSQQRLRENAIKALTISSSLEATKGNLQTAMTLADRAVAQRFDPIKEQIAINKANLDLLSKDPSLSLVQQNRLMQQKMMQEQKEREIKKQEENNKIAEAMSKTAIMNNPGNSAAIFAAQSVANLDPSDSQYLQKVYGLVGEYQTNPIQIQKDLIDLQYKQTQTENITVDIQLAKDKFEEDKRRYGIELALKNQKKIADKKAAEIVTSGADTLKQNALITSQELLKDFDAGKGTSAVGGNILNRIGFIGDWLGKGTGRSDFIVKFNNLKSLLSLDNVKYLKGQGQVSDAERRLLEQASAKLDRSQSETEFRNSLSDIAVALSGTLNNENNLAVQVAAKGYDYAKMKTDGLSDAEIKKELEI